MEPQYQSRWKKFKRHRRGFISLWIFLFVLVVSLLADVLCNEKPLVIYYNERTYFPIFSYHSEMEFGGKFDIEPDYGDPNYRAQLEKKAWVLWPLVRYSYNSLNRDLTSPPPTAPSWHNWLGTDDQGRDVFARLVYGMRISLLFGLALAFFGLVGGIAAGAVQGYYGGWVDLLFQRFIEIWSGLPILFLLMILSSIIPPSVFWLLGIMALFNWMRLVGVVRAEFLRARSHTYVRAAQVLGVKPLAIMGRHILPNAMVSALAGFPFLVSHSITTLTSLDFLGFGLPPGSPSLGELLQQAKTNLYAPWLGLTAFFSLSLILVLVTFIGEGVRDAFDPRQ